MKKIAMLLVIAALAFSAQANMTYAPFLLTGNDAAGLPIMSGTAVLVIDLDGDGWDGVDYTVQSTSSDNASAWKWDADDMLLDVAAIEYGIATPFKMIYTSDIPASYEAGVDEYYLLWFDVAFNPMADGPGAGVAYGAESLGTVGQDPGNYAPTAVGGTANLVTSVPEPATLALLASGSLALLRRKNA